MLGLGLLVPALVIGAGLTLALIYILLSRLVAKTTSSASYQTKSTALDQRQTQKISKMRETRPTSAAPESTWRRWSIVTTAITILMFVAFVALLFASVAFPSGQIIRNGAIVNIASMIVLVTVGITLLALVLWLRSDRINAINRTETMAIPWDFIAVVLSGLLVVGLGIGVIAILNAPK